MKWPPVVALRRVAHPAATVLLLALVLLGEPQCGAALARLLAGLPPAVPVPAETKP